jgi:hypothetical protein
MFSIRSLRVLGVLSTILCGLTQISVGMEVDDESTSRPTAEEVAKAIADSRAKSLPSREEQLKELRIKIRTIEATPPSLEYPARKQKTDLRLLRKAERELKDDEDYDSKRPLSPLLLGSMRTGTVGRLFPNDSRIEVLQRLDDNRFLGYIRHPGKPGYVVRSSTRGVIANVEGVADQLLGPYLMVGFKDRELKQEGGSMRLEDLDKRDVIVTGQYRYTSLDEEQQSVAIIEVFDPSRPFE